jgi:hypothetical protein
MKALCYRYELFHPQASPKPAVQKRLVIKCGTLDECSKDPNSRPLVSWLQMGFGQNCISAPSTQMLVKVMCRTGFTKATCPGSPALLFWKGKVSKLKSGAHEQGPSVWNVWKKPWDGAASQTDHDALKLCSHLQWLQFREGAFIGVTWNVYIAWNTVLAVLHTTILWNVGLPSFELVSILLTWISCVDLLYPIHLFLLHHSKVQCPCYTSFYCKKIPSNIRWDLMYNGCVNELD